MEVFTACLSSTCPHGPMISGGSYSITFFIDCKARQRLCGFLIAIAGLITLPAVLSITVSIKRLLA